MNWTQETPAEDGIYWYRRARDKVRQQVTVRGRQAIFASGTVKDLAALKGQWRGPMLLPQALLDHKDDGQGSGLFSRAISQLPGVLGGIFLTISAGLLLTILQGKFSLTEPRLVFVGETPLPVMKIEAKAEHGRGVAFLRKSVPFKNYGLVKDHIDKVEITRDGLNEMPPEVKIVRVDKKDLEWLEREEIEFEALLYFVAVPEDEKKMSFRATYYGSKGNEVYSTIITMNYVRAKKSGKE